MLRLLEIEPRGARSLGRLVPVAGTALAFVTVAIPLQLEKEWITIRWVLEGAALEHISPWDPKRFRINNGPFQAGCCQSYR